MSRGGETRFRKGQSGNPAGRPRQHRPQVSAFDIVFDQTLTVTQNGIERELTVDEALQLQTYQDALKGSKMAVRQVLKMIEKREAAITKASPVKPAAPKIEVEASSSNADAILEILGLAERVETIPGGPGDGTLKLMTWAAQMAISRPGRKAIDRKDRDDVERYTIDPHKLRWPRRRAHD